MKGLTLTQPWASLVAVGAKTIETRSWRSDYRGPLAIHAAKNLRPVGGHRGLRSLLASDPFFLAIGQRYFVARQSVPLGAIVAVAVLVDIVSTSDALGFDFIDGELPFGDYSPGRWAWVLSDVKPLDPPVEIPKGAVTDYRGLWDVPAGLVRP